MTELATQELARTRAARIRAGIGAYLATLADVAAAYAQRDWQALGYADWQSYVDGEYSEHRLRLSPEHRAKAVAELRLAGLSTRAIGSAVGISEATVRRDLEGASFDAPDEIQGADGKSYPSTQPPARRDPEPTSPGPAVATPGGPDTDFGEVLDRLVPDPNPHREWQGRFLDAISGLHKLMRFTPEDVAERADDQCLDELTRVAEQFGTYRAAVIRAVTGGRPDNVTPIRRIS